MPVGSLKREEEEDEGREGGRSGEVCGRGRF